MARIFSEYSFSDVSTEIHGLRFEDDSYNEHLVNLLINHITNHSKISTENVNTEFFYRTVKPVLRDRSQNEPMGMI